MENSQGISGEFMPETNMGNFYPAYKKSITFKGVDGVYGKHGKIYEISNNANPMAASASGYDICQPYIQVGKKNGISPATSNLSQGDKVRISFNLANKHLVNDRYAEINGTGLASGKLTIKANGEVTIFGEKMANLDIKSGKWYNFDLIITVGSTSSTADLYINGTKAGDTVTASASDTNITAINNVRIGYNGTQGSPVDGQKVFLEDGMYVDDIMFEYYPAGGEVFNASPVDIAESNGIVANELEATVTPMLSATVAKTKTDISISGASAFAFVNADGTPKSDEDSAEGGYLVINTTDGKTLVYESLNWSPAESTDFDSAAIDGENVDVLVMNEGIWKKNNEKKGHEYTLAGGLGSRDSDDKALAIVTNGTYGSNTYNPYLYYSFSPNGVAKEFTAEFSVFAGGGENGIDIMLTYYEDGTRQRKTVVNFNSNGDIESGDTVIGAWQPDRWYRVAVSCSPDSDNAELYINGVKYIADIAGQTDSPKAFANIRVTVDYPQAKEVSGVLGIDDFSFYYSGYCGEAASVEAISSDASNVLVDGDIIYTKNALTPQTLATFVKYDYENAKVYTDSTYTRELGTQEVIDDNAVLVIKAGLYCGYYSFKNLGAAYRPSIYVNARELPVLKNGKISARVCTDAAQGSQSKLIVAVYDGSEMKEVKISDIEPGFSVTRTEAITVSEYKSGVTAKAFVWENMDTIKPLTLATEK